MDPAIQQFFQNQMQLLENLTNIVANPQAQVNNPLHHHSSRRPGKSTGSS
jgi:hypothetical protein